MSFEAVEEYETEATQLIVLNQFDPVPKDFLHFHLLPSLLLLEVLNTVGVLLPNQAAVKLLLVLDLVMIDSLVLLVKDEAYAKQTSYNQFLYLTAELTL